MKTNLLLFGFLIFIFTSNAFTQTENQVRQCSVVIKKLKENTEIVVNGQVPINKKVILHIRESKNKEKFTLVIQNVWVSTGNYEFDFTRNDAIFVTLNCENDEFILQEKSPKKREFPLIQITELPANIT